MPVTQYPVETLALTIMGNTDIWMMIREAFSHSHYGIMSYLASVCHEHDYSILHLCVLQAQLAGLLGLSSHLQELHVQAASLAAEPDVPTDIQSSVGALSSRYDSTLQQLTTREQEINAGKHNELDTLMMMMMREFQFSISWMHYHIIWSISSIIVTAV